MIDSSVIAFAVAAGLLTVTPGNDTMLILRNSISGDRRAGFATLAGICAGTIVHGLFAALGISVILAQSAAAFNAVKLVGAGYIIYLAVLSLRSAWRGKQTEVVIEAVGTVGSQRLFKPLREGLLTNVLNPKVAIFYLSFLPQFISPGDHVLKPVFLAGIHVLFGIVWLSGVIVMVDRSKEVLRRSSVRRITEGLVGVVLLGLGVKLLLAKK